jgi:hypothetical protein
MGLEENKVYLKYSCETWAEKENKLKNKKFCLTHTFENRSKEMDEISNFVYFLYQEDNLDS